VVGGYGTPTFSWTGTDGLYGFSSSIAKVYFSPGQKAAAVTVTSGGQSAYAYCPAITVNAPYAYPQPYPQPVPVAPPAYSQPALDIACYVSSTKIKVGQAVTWTTEVRGGILPYRISWNGTDGLSGNQNTVTKYYGAAGTKRATLTITSADGRTSTRTCGASVVVSSGIVSEKGARATVLPQNPPVVYEPAPAPTYPVVVESVPAATQLASPFFSLSNVPWGWVAFLVILVLFVTVLYLLFNRLKI
jgi:hypothetical protein